MLRTETPAERATRALVTLLILALYLPVTTLGFVLMLVLFVFVALPTLQEHEAQFMFTAFALLALVLAIMVALGLRAASIVFRRFATRPTDLGSWYGIARRGPDLWYGATCILVGILTLIGGLDGSITEPRYLFDGARGDAVLVEKGVSADLTPTYWLESELTTVDGRVVRYRQNVESTAWLATGADCVWPTEYLRSEPRVHRAPGARAWIWSLPMVAIGTLFTAGGRKLLRRGWRRCGVVRRLRARGVRGAGTLLGVERHGSLYRTIDLLNWWTATLTYQWVDARGTLHQERETLIDEPHDTWAVPMTGQVWYDPERPEQAIWRDAA